PLFSNLTSNTQIYTLSLHDALPISMGAEVAVLSTSRDKEKDADRLGANRFVATREPGALDDLAKTFDLILDTVSSPHDLNQELADRKSTRLNSSHQIISYAVFCLKK